MEINLSWNKTMFAALGALILSCASVQAAGPLDTWTQVHSFPIPFTGLRGEASGDILASGYDIAFGENAFVVVGQQGRIWKTTNFKRGPWLEQKSPVTTTLSGVIYGNGKFVALSTGGRIVTSPDGEQWTSWSSGASNNLRAVALAAQGFIAVGDGGAVLLSADAEQWENLTLPDVSLRDVHYAGGQYAAVGKNAAGAGVVLSSANGREWRTVHVVPGKGLESITHGLGRFVAVGEDGAVVSATAPLVDWVTLMLPNPDPPTPSLPVGRGWPNDLIGIAAGPEGFVAAAWRWMFRSADGLNWVLVDEELPDPIPFRAPSQLPSASVLKLRYLGGRFVGVGTIAWQGPHPASQRQPLVVASEEGISWKLVSQEIHFRSVAYGNGRFVAVGEAGCIASSRTGTEWIEESNDVPVRLNKVAYGGGKFVAVGARGVIVTSEDGVRWTQRDSALTESDKRYWAAQFFDVAYGDGSWVAVGGTGIGVISGAPWPQSIRVMVTSVDGENWMVADRFGDNHWFTAVEYGNGKFLAMEYTSSRGRTFQWTSTNGRKWTSKESIGGSIPALAFGSGVFAVVRPIREVTRVNLTDGDVVPLFTTTLEVPTWKLGLVSTTTEGAIGFANDRFLFLGAGYVWSSENATNWVEHRVTASTNRLFGAAYGVGVYVAVGANGTILRSAPAEISVSDPQMTQGGFEFTARVPPEERTVVEFTDALGASEWSVLREIQGGESGKTERVADPAPLGRHRFYRVRSQQPGG